MAYAKTERQWAERAAQHIKAELKRTEMTYEEMRLRRIQDQHRQQAESDDKSAHSPWRQWAGAALSDI